MVPKHFELPPPCVPKPNLNARALNAFFFSSPPGLFTAIGKVGRYRPLRESLVYGINGFLKKFRKYCG